MKKVVITGGKGDIAQAIAIELRKDELFEIYTPGRDELDVTDCKSIEKYIGDIKPDILVNNAGFVVPQSIKNCDLELTRKHIEINLCGTYFCTAIALKCNPNLQIINIGSSAATKVHATWSEYCATKAAIVMATQCWAEDGLYAVCISPGRTRTKMRKELYPDEDQSTLLDPSNFAKVVMKAVRKEYPTGSHINVTKQNVEELINGKNSD